MAGSYYRADNEHRHGCCDDLLKKTSSDSGSEIPLDNYCPPTHHKMYVL